MPIMSSRVKTPTANNREKETKKPMKTILTSLLCLARSTASCAAALAITLTVVPNRAAPPSINFSTVSSTYDYIETESRDDLAGVIAGSPILCLESLEAATLFGGPNTPCDFIGNENHGYHLAVNFEITVSDAGPWSFRLGPDFGRGGAIFVDGVKLASHPGNELFHVWWNFEWDSQAVMYVNDVHLAAGLHSVEVFGFEDCCAGEMSLEYQIGSGGWREVSVANLTPPDSDGDGVPDDVDECPDSDLRPTVIIGGLDSGAPNLLFASGCTLSDLIRNIALQSRNRGGFVSAVTGLTNELRRLGFLTPQQAASIVNTAARAPIPY
jgi:hypothetical protein